MKRLIAATLATELAVGVLAGDSNRFIEPPTPEAIVAGQYACKMTVQGVLEQKPSANGIDGPRDQVVIGLELKPQASAAYTSQYPNGNGPDGIFWMSPTGSVFRRQPNHSAAQPGLPVGVQSEHFHDDTSPTGDDLNPTFMAAPRDSQPVGAVNDVYLQTEAFVDGQSGYAETRVIGYTLCGSMAKTGHMQWEQVSSDGAVQTLVYSAPLH
jgi:hypothetical protein